MMREILRKWRRCLHDQVDAGIDSITTDGVYDEMPIYDTGGIPMIIPPQVTAVLRSAAADHHPLPRDKDITLTAAKGRLGWQEKSGYGRRSLVETTMGRYKVIIGLGLLARSLPGQRAEATVGEAVLSCLQHIGRPNSARYFGAAS